MQTVRMSWPAMAIVLLALLACLGALVDADIIQIQPPRKGASPEEVRQYLEKIRKLLRLASKPRYGKRDIPEAEADLSKLLYPDIQDSSVEAVLWKLLFPDYQDTSVKSRPEGTYML